MDLDRNVNGHRKLIGRPSENVSEGRMDASPCTIGAASRDQDEPKHLRSKTAINVHAAKSENSIEPIKTISKRAHGKIGIPKYDIIKIRDPVTRQLGLRFELQLPKIKKDVNPNIRIMSAYEQTVEEVDTKHQYLVVAAEPYDTVALRIPALRINEKEKLTYFDLDYKTFYVQLLFDNDPHAGVNT